VAARAVLILDACVLIDFWDADPSVLTLVARHIGPVHVAEDVLTEAVQVDRAAANEVGLAIVEPTLEIMTIAARRRRGLSFQDHLCLLLAKKHEWTCVSNDARLRRACTEDGVGVLWGLELVARVVEARGLSPKAAIELANQMAAVNRYLTRSVIQRFVERVQRSPRRRHR
jgi:predicted nucleic acid-binding protein